MKKIFADICSITNYHFLEKSINAEPVAADLNSAEICLSAVRAKQTVQIGVLNQDAGLVNDCGETIVCDSSETNANPTLSITMTKPKKQSTTKPKREIVVPLASNTVSWTPAELLLINAFGSERYHCPRIFVTLLQIAFIGHCRFKVGEVNHPLCQNGRYRQRYRFVTPNSVPRRSRQPARRLPNSSPLRSRSSHSATCP